MDYKQFRSRVNEVSAESLVALGFAPVRRTAWCSESAGAVRAIDFQRLSDGKLVVNWGVHLRCFRRPAELRDLDASRVTAGGCRFANRVGMASMPRKVAWNPTCDDVWGASAALVDDARRMAEVTVEWVADLDFSAAVDPPAHLGRMFGGVRVYESIAEANAHLGRRERALEAAESCLESVKGDRRWERVAERLIREIEGLTTGS